VLSHLNVVENAFRGVSVQGGSTSTTIKNSLISGNAQEGVLVFTAPQTKVLGNKVFGNGQTGIAFESASNNGTIAGNVVRANAQGINIIQSTTTTITNNDVAGSRIDGIVVSNASNSTTISGNRSSVNGGEGINLSSSTNVASDNITL